MSLHLSVCQGREAVVIPQELSNHIFGHLKEDSISLRHSSLVCRSWLFASRAHLFHQIALYPKTLMSLATLLDKFPQSTILPFVRRLDAFDINSVLDDYPLLCELLTHFKSTLTHLYLKNIFLPDFVDLLDIICQFPQLRYFALDKVQWRGNLFVDHTTLQTRRRLPPHFDGFSVKSIDFYQIISWIVTHPEAPKVSHIEIGPLKEVDILQNSRNVSKLAGLKHLSIFYDSGDPVCESIRDYIPVPLDNSSRVLSPVSNLILESLDSSQMFPNLHTIRLNRFLDSSAPNQSTALLWAPRILTAIRPNKIRRVILCIIQCRAGDLDQHNIKWDFYDEMFAVGIYVNLTSIEFEISGKVNIDGIASLLSLRLPMAAKRGILQFRRVD